MIGRREPLPRIRIVEIERLPGDLCASSVSDQSGVTRFCWALDALDVVCSPRLVTIIDVFRVRSDIVCGRGNGQVVNGVRTVIRRPLVGELGRPVAGVLSGILEAWPIECD